jgi:hypothetical protein
MKYTALLITGLSFAFAWPAQAIDITIDFTEKDRLGILGGVHEYQFTELKGIEFLGQKISLDVDFAGDQFIRLFPLTAQSLEISFGLGGIFQDGSTPWPGFRALADNVNGYVTGKNGKQIKEATATNGVGGFEGTIGIFPLRTPELDGPFNPNIKAPFDIYGVHLEFTIGNYPGAYLTTGGFRVDSNPEWYYAEVGTFFGIGPSEYLPKDVDNYGEARQWWNAALVPDNGSTLALLGMALVAICGLGSLTRFRALT